MRRAYLEISQEEKNNLLGGSTYSINSNPTWSEDF
jgi:hypothetical protein